MAHNKCSQIDPDVDANSMRLRQEDYSQWDALVGIWDNYFEEAD